MTDFHIADRVEVSCRRKAEWFRPIAALPTATALQVRPQR